MYLIGRAPNSSYYYMQVPDEPVPGNTPATVVTVETPAETPIDSEESEDTSAALEAIGARIEAVETRITEGIEGERQWTNQEISSLKTEIADLRATLRQVATNLPAQMTAMREELTQALHALQAAQNQIEKAEETVEEITPPIVPPVESEVVTLETVSAENASPNAQSHPNPQRRNRNRVV